MKILIAGAGLGGLALALSLKAAGLDDVEVFEQAAEVKPVGVGINLLPHAVRELTELGLIDQIAARAVETEALMYANRLGQEIWREPRGRFAGYHWPQYSIHRGVLQMILFEACRERLGATRIHADRRLASFEMRSDGVIAHLTDGAGADAGTVQGDVLVGADGIHSAVRAQLYPAEGPPVWNQRILWRGVSRAAPYLGGATMIMAGHQDQKFVCYPIDPDPDANGKVLLNWIAELRFSETAQWRREDWNRAGRLEDFLPRFAGWRFGWLDAPSVITAAERVYEYPMVDRDPIDRWSFGRVTLLGDAAHAMYPIGSNGASQAILDARTLAHELAVCRDPQEALSRYDAARRPGVNRLVLLNRGNGPEQVMQLAHERAPDGYGHIHEVLSQAELEATAGAYKQAAGFDRDALNARASLSPPPFAARDTLH